MRRGGWYLQHSRDRKTTVYHGKTKQMLSHSLHTHTHTIILFLPSPWVRPFNIIHVWGEVMSDVNIMSVDASELQYMIYEKYVSIPV